MPGFLRIHDSKKGQGTWTGAFCGAGTTDPSGQEFWTTDCKPTNQQNPLQINSDNATKTEHKPHHFKRGFISQCHDMISQVCHHDISSMAFHARRKNDDQSMETCVSTACFGNAWASDALENNEETKKHPPPQLQQAYWASKHAPLMGKFLHVVIPQGFKY